MKVEQLPGIGPGVAASIRRRFGSDAAFFAAARAMDLQAIADVDGISERRAVELVRAVRGEAPEEFLATPAARAVHERLLEAVQAHAGTRHGRNRLRLLSPLPDVKAAQARMRHVLDLQAQVARLDADAVRAAMRRLHPLADPAPRCDTTRLVVAETSAAHERLHALGVGRWSILGTRRDLAMAGDMELVVVAYEEGGLNVPDMDAVEEVPAGAGLADLAPAALLHWVDQNRGVLEACQRLAELTGRTSAAPEALAARQAVQVPRVDASGLVREVTAVHKEADAAVQVALRELSLSGTELLAAMQGALPATVRRAIDSALAAARARLKQTTGMDFQPLVAALPVRVDDDEVERVQRRMGAEGRLRRERSERDAARRIARVQEAVAAEVAHWLEWDADFALGSFAHSLGLRPWRPGRHLAFTHGIHLDLAAQPGAQRIAYTLGGEAPISLLTGANSGGKSTLLEQVCQIAVMARLGLPVIGDDVEVPWVDEVHLVTARRGLDAGAFETFLRAFLPASLGGARRLVLADEVESVTELEAAGRILAFFIERMLATDSLGIVVSHVPQAILGHLPDGAVRVDGIEAKGLDDRHRLVVDRQPQMGRLARSTPELIVERLSRTTKGDEQRMYADLLGRLRHVEPPLPCDQETRK